MLTTLKEADFDKYVDLAYSLALDQSKSAYPTYTDGIKTRSDFISASKKAFNSTENEILLFEYEGVVEGWIQYYWMPRDKYISLSAFNISCHMEAALKEFTELLNSERSFKGYSFYAGFPGKNIDAINFLIKNGFKCIEEDNNNSFFFDRYSLLPQNQAIKRITEENYDDFRKLHSEIEGEMYWNSDRIYENLHKWNIYGYYEEELLKAAVYYIDETVMLEIFGIDFYEDTFVEAIYRELLIAVLNGGKRLGASYMTYFCDKECQETVSKLGFELVGEYVCYIKQL